jgi:hypothetical protein
LHGFRGYINYGTTGDAFIAKINTDSSSLVFSSYLGGSCEDSGSGIFVNADGSVWLVGTTFSPDFPVTSNALQPVFGGGFGDGFVARVSTNGDLDYSTYLGGSDLDEIAAITLDALGNLYLTGSSAGFSEPASPGAFQQEVDNGCAIFGGPPGFYPDGNAFVIVMNPTATAVTGLTYLGGRCSASGNAIALDPSGGIWIAGSGLSFPTVNPLAVQTSGYISKFSSNLTQLLFSTYFDWVDGMAINPSGMALVTGFTTAGPEQAYLAKIDLTPTPITLENVMSASPSPSTPERIAPGKIIRLEGNGLGPATQTPGIVNNDSISTNVAGVQVTFDSVPAALLYVSPTEIECITPWAVPVAATTTIQVTYGGLQSNTLVSCPRNK